MSDPLGDDDMPVGGEIEGAARSVDRRALLRKAAVVGAVGWTAPVIVATSVNAQSSFFTPKCDPGATSASASFSQADCGDLGLILAITVNFSGPCPCGGAEILCAVKSSPGGSVFSSSGTLTFEVGVPIETSRQIDGQVALGCTDRDGDTRFLVSSWSMTATDSGAFCDEGPGSISGVSVTAGSFVDTDSCPLPVGATLSLRESFNVGGPRVRR